MNRELRKRANRALDDFLKGSPIDADALEAHLSNHGLVIVDPKSLVKYAVDSFDDYVQSRPMIDPVRRERVDAVPVDEVREFMAEAFVE